MSQAACADRVARADPDRYLATLAAPVARRADLFTLYAFNLEIARAPWVTSEPLIAEMRLQWWRDVVAEPGRRAHEVAAPLHDLIHRVPLPLAVIERMIAARSWDIGTEPFADPAAFARYIDDTSGSLMWLAALICGAGPGAEPAVRDFGYAAGLAAFLRAVPVLEARGRRPLPEGRPAAVKALAEDGLRRLAAARRARATIGAGQSALLAGWQAGALLRQAVAQPQRVAGATLGLSDFGRRGRLVWQSLTGRW